MGSSAKTVVVAEADPQDRARVVDVITALASEVGLSIELHETENGEEADRLIGESKPDLVVCEILLDNVSGLELLRKQRARHGDDAVPFIFVTHMTAETDRYWGLRNGAFAYVMKPYEPKILERRVRKALGQPEKKSSSSQPKANAGGKPKPPPIKSATKTKPPKVPKVPKVPPVPSKPPPEPKS